MTTPTTPGIPEYLWERFSDPAPLTDEEIERIFEAAGSKEVFESWAEKVRAVGQALGG